MAKMINKHIKITPVQNDKLMNLSKKSGYNQNEIIRMMLDDLDEVNVAVSQQHNEVKLASENKLYSAIVYWNGLCQNLTNNVNQLAKYANTHHELPNKIDSYLSSVLKYQDNMSKEVNKYYERR